MAAGLSDLVARARDAVQALGNLSQTIARVFPAASGTSATATAGAAVLPANPVGFIVVTLPNGTTAKVPYYGS